MLSMEEAAASVTVLGPVAMAAAEKRLAVAPFVKVLVAGGTGRDGGSRRS